MISITKAKELSEYFQISLEGILERYNQIQKSPSKVLWVTKSNNEWINKVSGKSSKKEVEKWFRETEQYIFELMENHSLKPRNDLTRKIVRLCKNYNLQNILDFGGGIGEDSIVLAKAGFDVTLADIPGKTLEFAKWRIKKNTLKVKIVEAKNASPLEDTYDAIVCLEVFQHLFYPIKAAKHLYAHIKRGGLLLLTTRFYNPSYFMALKKNYKYEHSFGRLLETIGFNLEKKIYLWGKEDLGKFLYVYQKK